MAKGDSKRERAKIAWTIVISLLLMDFPLVMLLDLLDLGTNDLINALYLVAALISIGAGFYFLLSTKSTKSRFISGFMIYVGIDITMMVLANYL